MRKMRNVFLVVLATLGCMVLPSGCVEEESDWSEWGKMPVRMSVGTRAVSDTDEETAGEQTVTSLRVYAFSKGRRIGHYVSEEIPKLNADGKYSFTMDIAMLTTGATQEVDFYLLANEGAGSSRTEWSETLSEAELKDARFDQLKGTSGELPMAEVSKGVTVNIGTTVENAGHPGHSATGETIPFTLKRVVGRLGVYFAKETGNDKSLVVKSITLKESGRRKDNYFFEPSEAQLLAGNWSESPWTVYKGNMEIERKTTLGDNKTEHYDLVNSAHYLFENPYGSLDPDKEDVSGVVGGKYRGNVMEIVYAIDGVDKIKTVYLPAIERNNFYQVFCVVPAGGGIKVSYAVAEWKVEETDLDVDYPTYTCSPLEEGVYATTAWYTADESEKEKGAFGIKFSMTQPAKSSWKASVSGGKYMLKVYEDGTDKLVSEGSTAEGEAAQTFYRIYVIPTEEYDSEHPNADGVLRISTKTWAGDNDLLLINRDGNWNKEEGKEAVRTEIRIQQVPRSIEN